MSHAYPAFRRNLTIESLLLPIERFKSAPQVVPNSGNQLVLIPGNQRVPTRGNSAQIPPFTLDSCQ